MDINIENMKANSNDREYVLKTVKEQGKMLEFASSELQDDEEILRGGFCGSRFHLFL